jgi:hypothetical protein
MPTTPPTSGPRPTTAAAAHASLRRGVSAVAPVDEALAWLTQELELNQEELEALGEAISYPTRSLSRTAIVLTRRLLDGAETDGGPGRLPAQPRAPRYSELGRWGDARRHTERAVDIMRTLAEYDRDRHLPDLAAAVSNLASCLAQLGERDAALRTSYEAVAMHRELLEVDRDRHLPALARALTNLSACLSRSGRRPGRAGGGRQAGGHLPGAGRGPPQRVPGRTGGGRPQLAHLPPGAGPAGRGSASAGQPCGAAGRRAAGFGPAPLGAVPVPGQVDGPADQNRGTAPRSPAELLPARLAGWRLSCCSGTAAPRPTPTAPWPVAAPSGSTTPASRRRWRSASAWPACRCRRVVSSPLARCLQTVAKALPSVGRSASRA